MATVQPDRACDPPAPDTRRRTLVLGLGNPLLGDDAAGLRAAAELRRRLRDRPEVEVDELCAGGLSLMERLVGYDRVVLVDSACLGSQPGSVRVWTGEDLPTRHSGSAHDVSLADALSLGRRAGAALPQPADIQIVGIEASGDWCFAEECSAPVQAGIARAADAVIGLLDPRR